jgi:DNA-directed RNA polymerase subunit RPC12/RpoP
VKAVWLVVALVVIVGSLAFLMHYYSSQPEPGERVAHMAPVKCAACGKVYAMMLSTEPAECRYCGEVAVWRAQQCAKCGEIIPVIGGSSFGSAAALKCPKCGCTSFTEVSPDAVSEP